ncbi:MAG: DUF3880 domain-containing protein [Clostridia bacterium]|jgi:hypothetical protein|nr:DUF3880 domain-containing protein [Clostridia bacterium]
MTYADFCCECNSVFITPYNWKEVLKKFKPDILFCESAWSGITQYKNCWRGRIYKNHSVKFETRRELLKILEYCKKNNIKTAFWNKEDPTYFGNEQYDFVDTALKFEYIFTTAEECVEKYKAFGHKNVYVLMFGFSPYIFNPLNSRPNENKAVFAGSWYNDQLKRCKEIAEIFSMLEKNKIDFDIIDRQSNSKNPIHEFPKEYKNHIYRAIPFQKLGQKMKKYRFAININTVTNSKTMFARRVFEMMAENKVIISNFSVGMKQLFNKNVWFIGEEFDFSRMQEISAENLHDVFLNHTCRHRLEEILKICGLSYERKCKDLLVVLNNQCDKILWDDNIKIVLKKEDKFYDAQTNEIIANNDINNYKYFMFAKRGFHISKEKLDFLISQFFYLDIDCGIIYSENKDNKFIYKVIKNTQNYNVMFDISKFQMINQNIESNVNKIYVI